MRFAEFGGPYLEAGLEMLSPSLTLREIRITFDAGAEPKPRRRYWSKSGEEISWIKHQAPGILVAMENLFTINRRIRNCFLDMNGLRSFRVEVEPELYNALAICRGMTGPSLVDMDRRVGKLKRDLQLPPGGNGHIVPKAL